ncbi:hypothetical protein SacN8_09540 [Sulfolobus acidocaldarius N8]|uniref:Uncharacterized protein n=2 Tax=Sulfolobus acidocaldarius TaxID=2285 RepID=M1J0J7_9CREN|nr:hypothetical protein SacN8_09540 [Sulfolobus acidocaldarius N8]AGE74137.1 hypothetical protein SacRon12I_09560 [Sulfolobus acidocaldarius Ron12/I]WCM35734.1 hypothetical protein GO597_10535 [Sulfolobus acidocaldarius DSM 639]
MREKLSYPEFSIEGNLAIFSFRTRHVYAIKKVSKCYTLNWKIVHEVQLECLMMTRRERVSKEVI